MYNSGLKAVLFVKGSKEYLMLPVYLFYTFALINLLE